MRRILIIGSGGAGKSTLARRLGEVLGLPVVHLDCVFWKPGWVETPRDEFEPVVRDIVAGEEWIIDGNFGGTMDMRLDRADTAIYLDLSRLTCLHRALRRLTNYRGRTRPDIAPGCSEKADLEFLLWIWNFPKRSRPVVMERLRRFNTSGGQVVILRSPERADRFLDTCRRRS